jgi:hypothetical protein
MTRELRTTIEPSDVKAIELECLSCHGRQTIMLDKWQNDRGVCPDCKAAWPQTHSFAFQNLFRLVGHLAEAKKVNGTKDLPFAVRFEITSEPDKAKT